MRRNYYVYCHRRKDTGEIFYIGRGTGDRIFRKDGRSRQWLSVCEAHGIDCEILWEELTLSEAKDIEQQYIELLSDSLVNIGCSGKHLDLGAMSIESLFYYDETSPSCLRWAVDRPRGNGFAARAGDIAGCFQNRKTNDVSYWMVKVFNKSLTVHRVVYFLNNGVIGENNFIDHVNGNTKDNRITNLREVTQLCNNRNTRIVSSSNTGELGISVMKNAVRCKVGRDFVRAFSIRRYGIVQAMYLAKLTRAARLEELRLNGDGFGPNHGYKE